ncbi:MAG: glycosyltransferase family 4 protein [Armatimonadota bacterium]
MKILLLEHLFPLPPDSGGKIKSLGVMRALASEHEVKVLSFVRNDAELAGVSELSRLCGEVVAVPFSRSRIAEIRCALASIVFRRSYIISRDFRRAMLGRTRDIIRGFQPDVVHIDHLQMSQFVDFGGSYATVLDEHNVEYMIVKRMSESSASVLMRTYARLEWPKLRRYETQACSRADLVLAVSDQDAEALRQLVRCAGDTRSKFPAVETVPIGVDVSSISVVDRDPYSKNILFLGTMYWPPNIECVLYFYYKIFPMIRRALPDCTFTIAGQKPPGVIQDLARDPAVRVTGYVDDVRVVAASCGVFIVPLRSGSGVRVKILDALAMGLPVVATSIGAEGLVVRSGEHLLIADEPQQFAQAVISVLTDRQLAERLGMQGRELVEREYSWEVVGRRLLNVYAEHLLK